MLCTSDKDVSYSNDLKWYIWFCYINHQRNFSGSDVSSEGEGRTIIINISAKDQCTGLFFSVLLDFSEKASWKIKNNFALRI